MKKIPDHLILQLEDIKQSLYITSYSFMQNENDALEIVSQTIFIILKKYKQLKNPQYFKTWATRILINECKKELKKKKTTDVKSDIEIIVEDISYLPLHEAISQLPSDLRILVELKYFQDYTLKEISYMFDKPITTISSQLKKALQLLKLELEVEDE